MVLKWFFKAISYTANSNDVGRLFRAVAESAGDPRENRPDGGMAGSGPCRALPGTS